MRKLGEGWQYTVYDLGNGRVRKKYNAPLRSVWIILKDIIPGELAGMRKIAQYIPDLKKKALQSFDALASSSIPKEWLANPARVNGLDYEQDKVVPLADLFAKYSLPESKALIDEFIEFNQRLMRYRLIDKFFNMTKNFGKNKRGEIVLMDLGELESNVQKITRLRQARVWAVPYKLKWLKSHEVRAYFVQEMDKHFKLEEDNSPNNN